LVWLGGRTVGPNQQKKKKGANTTWILADRVRKRGEGGEQKKAVLRSAVDVIKNGQRSRRKTGKEIT